MRLSRYTINRITGHKVEVPDAAIFALPEKVLQFGTGDLLRGVPDYFIDKANREGVFNGRVVVVDSGKKEETAAFEQQDCLYTLFSGKRNDGECREERSINAAISRVLHAATEWQLVLECAHNPELKVILANTAEKAGLVKDDARLHPPLTFPGKLLSFLYERFKAFGGSSQSGMVIVATEAIPDNGKKLEAVVFELAHLNGLEDRFIEWLEACNQFCNSILHGAVGAASDSGVQEAREKALGYKDRLLLFSGTDRWWAIEGDETVKVLLSFCKADTGVVITPSFAGSRELQQRLLKKAGDSPEAASPVKAVIL